MVWESVLEEQRAGMESDAIYLHQPSFNSSDGYSFESSFFLTLDKTVEVNQARDNVYIFTCLPILCLALIVNSLAVVVIWRKEQTGLNSLIICDCLVNMVTMFLSVVHQSPWFIGWPRWVCLTYGQTYLQSVKTFLSKFVVSDIFSTARTSFLSRISIYPPSNLYVAE